MPLRKAVLFEHSYHERKTGSVIQNNDAEGQSRWTIAPADDALGSRVLGNESIRAGIKRSRLKLGSLHQTSKIVRLGPSDFGPVRFPTSNVPERRFQGTLTQMSQTIGTSGNELVELRGLRLLFRFELLTNLLRKAPERIVFPQLLQRIVFRGIGEGFSFERVCAAIEG